MASSMKTGGKAHPLEQGSNRQQIPTVSQLVTLDLPERVPAGWQAQVVSSILGGSGLEKHHQEHIGGLVWSLSPTK